MKYIFILAFICHFSFAQEMTVSEHLKLHTYNNRPSLQLRADRQMQTLAKINKQNALQIARKVCLKGKIVIKLTHKNRLLFYIAKTPSCEVRINALDGSLILPDGADEEQK